MPGLNQTDTEVNENIEAVLEEAADDFSPPHLFFFTFEAEASHNMLANVDKLMAAVHKSLGIVELDSPLYRHDFWVQRPEKTFPVHEQIESPVYITIESLQEEIFTSPKNKYLISFQWKRRSLKSGLVIYLILPPQS